MMRVEHVSFADSMAAILIPFSKSDVMGDGRTAYLSPKTTKLLKQWLQGSNLKCGPYLGVCIWGVRPHNVSQPRQSEVDVTCVRSV
jgi:hypothetical protein